VSALAPAHGHDSVVGDLLEEYRESQVPERGVAAADRWFVRQALGFLWTASAPAAWAMAGNLSARTLLDVSLPTADLSARAWITTLIAMGIFAWHGFRLGRSTGRIVGAMPLALAATVLGTMFAYALTFAMFAMFSMAAALDADPRAWVVLREGLDVPAHLIAVIGVVLATAGAAAGRMAKGLSASRAATRT
jgi:hypothetical protein